MSFSMINVFSVFCLVFHLISANQDTCNVSEPAQLYGLSNETLVYRWKGLNVSNVALKEEKILESEVFSLAELKVSARVQLKISPRGAVHTYVGFVRPNAWDNWTAEVIPRIHMVMKIEKNGQIIDTIYRSNDLDHLGGRRSFIFYNFLNTFWYFEDKPEVKYEPEVTFSIEIYMDTLEMANDYYSINGTVRGTLCPYSKLREWRSKGSIRLINSPYFLTGPKGPRAKMEFDFESDLHINCYLKIVFNSLERPLEWALWPPKFRAKVTFINQVDANRSVTKVEQSTDLLRFHAPEVSDFIMNDQLMYEASVQLIN